MAQQRRKARRRPGPKPRGPYADQRRTITTRITEKTRHTLEKSAERRDRSLSQEIEFRLEQSFMKDEADERVRKAVMEGVYEMFGGEQRFSIMNMFAWHWTASEALTGKSWRDDPTPGEYVVGGVKEFFKHFGPQGKPKESRLEQMFVEEIGRDMMTGTIESCRAFLDALIARARETSEKPKRARHKKAPKEKRAKPQGSKE